MYCEFTVSFGRDEFTVQTHHLINPSLDGISPSFNMTRITMFF